MRKLIIILLSVLLAGTTSPHPTLNGKPKIYIFLAAGCPCAFSHRETFGYLIKKYRSKVDFSVVFIDKNDDMEEISDMLKNLGWDIKYIVDEDQILLNQYRPNVSTDCVLVTSEGKILYKGTVDDSPLNYGQVLNFYLKNALEDYFNNKPIRVKEGQGVGCIINWKK